MCCAAEGGVRDDPEDARHLVGAVFQDLVADVDAGFVPTSAFPDLEWSQQQCFAAVLVYEPTRAFLGWCKAIEGLIEINPAADVRVEMPKAPKNHRSRRPFTADEL